MISIMGTPIRRGTALVLMATGLLWMSEGVRCGDSYYPNGIVVVDNR